MVTKKTSAARNPSPGDRVRLSSSLILQGEKQFYSVTMPTDMLAQCCFVTSRDEDPQAGFSTRSR